MIRKYLFIIFILLISNSVFSATVVLKNGSIIVGEIIDENELTLTIKLENDSQLIIAVDQIEKIYNDDSKITITIDTDISLQLESETSSDESKTDNKKNEVIKLLSYDPYTEPENETSNATGYKKLKNNFSGKFGFGYSRLDIGLISIMIGVNYWVEDYISVGINLRMGFIRFLPFNQDFSGEIGFQGGIEARLHGGFQSDKYRPYLGIEMGFVSDQQVRRITRFQLGPSFSLLFFSTGRLQFDFLHTELMFVHEPDRQIPISRTTPFSFSAAIDFFSVSYLFKK